MGEKFANHISNMGLISKIYKEPIQPNSKTTLNILKNKKTPNQEDLNIFPKEAYRWPTST